MALSIFMSFWAVSMLFIIIPGADWAYVISAGLRGRVVVPAIFGMLSGHLIAILIVAAGVGALVSATPSVLSVLTIAGAAYLMWLGINILRHPPVPEATASQNTASWKQWALKGLCVSGLNPKVFLLFLALLPQFTDPTSHWPVPLQLLALGMMHIVSCSAIYLIIGFSAQATLATRPQAAMIVSRVSGGVMMLLAIFLFAEQAIKFSH